MDPLFSVIEVSETTPYSFKLIDTYALLLLQTHYSKWNGQQMINLAFDFIFYIGYNSVDTIIHCLE